MTKPITKYGVLTTTPWGRAQVATYYGRGVIFYSTASHGGFHVSPGMLKRIPDYLQTADKYADGTRGWFEEDCAAAIVVVCFPELFTPEMFSAAVGTMENHYSEGWEKLRFEGIPVPDCRNCGIPTGNVGEVLPGLCNLCALASGKAGAQ